MGFLDLAYGVEKMQTRGPAVVCLIIGCLSSSTWPRNSNPIHAYTWWQTSCQTFHTEPDIVVAVFFREFPVTDKTANDKGKSRTVTFEPNGLGVRLGEERFAVRTIDINTVAVRPLGNRNDNRSSALEMTITTTNGVLSGGPIGTIELSCWREIEAVVTKYGITK